MMRWFLTCCIESYITCMDCVVRYMSNIICLFHVVPNVAPHNIQVIHSNLTMVTVSWTPLNYSEGQGIVTGYFVSLFSLSDCPPSFVTAIIVEGQLTHTVTFANLQHNVKYAAEVAGKTTVGLGVLSDMITGMYNQCIHMN